MSPQYNPNNSNSRDYVDMTFARPPAHDEPQLGSGLKAKTDLVYAPREPEPTLILTSEPVYN